MIIPTAKPAPRIVVGMAVYSKLGEKIGWVQAPPDNGGGVLVKLTTGGFARYDLGMFVNQTIMSKDRLKECNIPRSTPSFIGIGARLFAPGLRLYVGCVKRIIMDDENIGEYACHTDYQRVITSKQFRDRHIVIGRRSHAPSDPHQLPGL